MKEAENNSTGGDSLDEKTLGALCYVPIMFINWIAIIYILLVRKNAKVAKFHAFQALGIYLTLLVVGIALGIVMSFISAALSFMGIFSMGGGGSTASVAPFAAIWGGSVLMIIVVSLGSLAVLLYLLYLAFLTYSGKDPRVPILGKKVEEMV